MKMRLDGTCLECGDPLARHAGDTRRSDTSFCCGACRKTFNNRRAMRGAELYDLYMAHRFDHRVATDLGVMQAINRLASFYRQEDQRSRNGARMPNSFHLDEEEAIALATRRIGVGETMCVLRAEIVTVFSAPRPIVTRIDRNRREEG